MVLEAAAAAVVVEVVELTKALGTDELFVGDDEIFKGFDDSNDEIVALILAQPITVL